MGLFDFFKNKDESEELGLKVTASQHKDGGNVPEPTASAPKTTEEKQDVIRFFDQFGRPAAVPKEQWRTNILPKALEAHYNDPVKLYADILGAVQQGLQADVLEAAKHLVSIDGESERSHVALSIVYQRLEQPEEAQKVLENRIASHGPSGILLTNLAKVYHQKGDLAKCEETLWEGLQLNPNQTNGLPWYATIQLQKGGRESYIQVLEKASQIEGAWLPQLYLAREDLRDKKLDAAMQKYQQVIADHPSETALLMSTGDLGRAGCFREMVELAAPIYNIKTYGYRVGLNLLHAYLNLKDVEHGEPLLSSLLMLERPDIKGILMQASNAFEKMQTHPLAQPAPGELQMQMITFEKPIWYYSLGDPHWLLPQADRKTRIVLMPYADLTHPDVQENHAAKEDESGRMTRSIPLYLLECLLYRTSYLPRVIMPYAKNVGPVLTKAEATDEYIRQAAERFQGDYLITGSILASPMGFGVNTIIYDRAKDRFERTMKILSKENFGGALHNMMEDILQELPATEQPQLPVGFAPNPSDALMKQYLIALAQNLTQCFVVNGQMSAEALWGERNMLNWYLNLCLSDTNNAAARVILLSGLSRSRLYRSRVSLEFEKQALRLFSASKQKIDQLLLPFLLRIYNLQQPLDQLKAALPADRDDSYTQWVKKM